MRFLIWIFLLPAIRIDADEQLITGRTHWAVVSTLPDIDEKEFVEKLQELGTTTCGTTISVTVHYTFGNDDRMKDISESISKEGVCGLVFMDAQSAKLAEHNLAIPSVVLVPTSSVLHIETTNCELSMNVIETLPQPDRIIAAIRRYISIDTKIGIIYASDEPGHLIYLKNLRNLFLQFPDGPLDLLPCPISKGACKNLIDMQYGLEVKFSKLKQDDIIIVLPASNAIKFSFVIKQFAEAKGIHLIGVEKFRTNEPHGHVAYTNKELAKECVKHLCETTMRN